MVIRPLTAADFDALPGAFNEAFSDYVVPFQITREQLAEMLRRRAWLPEASVAAFEGDRIVAFTLNGVDGNHAYDSGTGVVPTHRRQGLAREMMVRSIDLLRAHRCTSYVLEVLEQNEKAVALYRGLGFEETRKLQCWRYEGHGHSSPSPLRLCDSETLRLAWDVTPSWQNSPAAIQRAADPHHTLGDEHGCVVVFPSNGDVPQLAVAREARRRGIGTRLLHEASALAGKPLRIMNVDDRDAGIAAFLEAAGATRTVRQLEMLLAL